MSDFDDRGVDFVTMRVINDACRTFVAEPTMERAPDTERWWTVVDERMRRPMAVKPQAAWHRVSAVLATIAVVGLAFVVLSNPRAESGIPFVQSGNTYVTGGGQRARVSLSDGSFVTLAPNSRLQVASAFGDKAREVQLDGEAVFTVSQVAGAPFLVRTGHSTTTVLGTTFAIRQYDTDAVARVVVAEGRVGVDGEQVLNAGDLAMVDQHKVATVRRSADIGPYFGGTAGHLTFRDSPAREVLETLGRWYSLTLTVREASLLDDRLTLSLDNASEQEMINVVALALGATPQRFGSQVRFVVQSSRHSVGD